MTFLSVKPSSRNEALEAYYKRGMIAMRTDAQKTLMTDCANETGLTYNQVKVVCHIFI